MAWVRTALALIAGGLVLTQFGNREAMQVGLGVAILLLGAMMAILGYIRFHIADQSIRANHLPPAGHGPIILVGVVVGFAIILTAIEFIRF